MIHCDTCPFPEGTRCESAIPCVYNDNEEHKRKADFCEQKIIKLLQWEAGHILSVLEKLKKEIELTQQDISLLNTIYKHVK